MKTKVKGTAKERIAAFLKKAGKKRYTAEQVAKKCGCCADYVGMHDHWKEYRKQFDKPTVNERVQEYLSKVGKTIPPVNEVAQKCGSVNEVVSQSPSWKAHVKRNRPMAVKERIKLFLVAVWDDSEKHTAPHVAMRCKCSRSSVAHHELWKKYRQKKRTLPAKERVRRFLAKDKTCKKKYTLTTIAEKLQLSLYAVGKAPAYQEYAHRIRQMEGKKIVKYTIPKRTPSPDIEKQIASYLSKNKHRKNEITVREVATKVERGESTVENSISWIKHRNRLIKLKPENVIKALLFNEKGNPNLNERTEKKYQLEEVVCALGLGRTTVQHSENWGKYQEHFAKEPAEKRIKEFLFYNNGKTKLAKDKTSKRPFTAKEVATAVGCAEVTVLNTKEVWQEYQEKVQALRPKGTAEERINKVLQELSVAGETNPKQKQVAEKSQCSTGTVSLSNAWQNRRRLFPTIEERIDKVLQEFLKEGTPSPTRKMVAARARCFHGTVERSLAWKQHRQRLSANDSPVAPEPDIAGYAPMTAAASGRGISKTAIEAHHESIEWAEEPANVHDVKVLDAIENNTAVLQRIEERIPTGKTIYESTYRANARFGDPTDETPIEKVNRLRCDGVDWKYIGRTIYREEHEKNINEKDLDGYVDLLRKQHKREYPEFYKTERKTS